MKLLSIFGVLALVAFQSVVWSNDIPPQCKVGEECVIELPGLICGDGTPGYYSLVLRSGAENLLIYMQGGGACWDNRTCNLGLAQLSRPQTGTDFHSGKGIFNSQHKENPFGKDYNIAYIPYCTGDVFTGNKINNYGTAAQPKTVRHLGYDNVLKTMKELKRHFPNPSKAVLLGVSAGGIGAYYHMGTLVKTYPKSQKYVISDAGTPFEPPFVNKTKYEKITAAWGAKDTLPQKFRSSPVTSFGELIEYNRFHYPDVRFGLISSYRDYIMTFFAFTIGSASPKTAVFDILQDVADNRLGANFANGRVYYLNESNHDYSKTRDLDETVSEGLSLGKWITSMVSDEKGWQNIRPQNVPDSWNRGQIFPQTIDELRNWPLQ